MSNVFQTIVAMKHNTNETMLMAYNKAVEGSDIVVVKELYEAAEDSLRTLGSLSQDLRVTKNLEIYSNLTFVKQNTADYKQYKIMVETYIACYKENEVVE